MLKKLSTALELGLFVALLSIPAASFAGNGIPNPSGDRDGVPDLLCEHGVVIDGVCYKADLGSISTEGNFDVAKGPNGPQTGDQDGIPDRDCLRDGSCNELISTEGNFDVAAGQQKRINPDPDCDDPIGDPWWMDV